MPIIPASEMLSQEDSEFQASLGYLHSDKYLLCSNSPEIKHSILEGGSLSLKQRFYNTQEEQGSVRKQTHKSQKPLKLKRSPMPKSLHKII